MNLKILKRLAKSNKYQMLYHRAKDLNYIRLFKNELDFTEAQITFLYYLELYSMLYQDLHDEELYISEEVIDDDFLTEAYLIWKNKYKKKEEKQKEKSKKRGQRHKEIDYDSDVPGMVFH